MTLSPRAQTVLDGMSFTERVGQLNQRLLGWRAVERGRRGFRLSDEGRREIDRWGGLGALYGLFRADAWSGRRWEGGIRPEERAEVADLVQREVRAASGIGVLLSEEAPHGHQALGGTVMPVALSAAASFDADLMAEVAAAVAAELAASGTHLALVSTLDLLRDPRWGRSEECFGDDPFLASKMTTAVVEGMQGVDRSRVGSTGVAVVLKHLAAQGEAAGGRNGQSSIIGPRDLEELHLPMVAAGVAAGAWGFMAAYNDIDGIPCCANPALLRKLLRDTYRFDGIVMADGLAVDRLEAITGSIAAAGRLALLSGVDLSLWDRGFATLDAAEDDLLVRSAVDEACGRILTLKDQFGLLGEHVAELRPDLDAARTHADRVSRLAAASGLVLLDDGGTLPWAPESLRDVVVAGPFADDPTAMLGDYVAPQQNRPATVVDAMRTALPTARVRLAADEAEALELASTADAVVVVLGGTSHRSYDDEFASNGAASVTTATSGEGVDLADLDLPADQRSLLRGVAAAARGAVATVIVAGRPHVLTPVVEARSALLWAGFPGPHGGAAIVDALLGRRSPSGRLPFTAPRAGGVVPVHHNDRHDSADVYRDMPRPVLYDFGAGRGYADATIRSARARLTPDGIEFAVDVHNPHAVDAALVVPVYGRRTDGTVLPRRRELVAIIRGTVAPGAEATISEMVAGAAVRPAGPDRAATVQLFAGDHLCELTLPACGPPTASSRSTPTHSTRTTR